MFGLWGLVGGLGVGVGCAYVAWVGWGWAVLLWLCWGFFWVLCWLG